MSVYKCIQLTNKISIINLRKCGNISLTIPPKKRPTSSITTKFIHQNFITSVSQQESRKKRSQFFWGLDVVPRSSIPEPLPMDPRLRPSYSFGEINASGLEPRGSTPTEKTKALKNKGHITTLYETYTYIWVFPKNNWYPQIIHSFWGFP